MLRTLDDYFDRMLAINADAERHVLGGAENAATLARLRREQAQTMTSYQLYVHRELFEPLIAGGVPADVARARALKVECISLSEDFRAYSRRWTEQNPADHWAIYRAGALEMTARVREHVANVRAQAPDFSIGRSPTRPRSASGLAA